MTRKQLEESIDKVLATSTMTDDEKAKYRADQLKIFDQQEALRTTASNLEEQRKAAEAEIEKQKKANYNLYLETLGKKPNEKNEDNNDNEDEEDEDNGPSPEEMIDDVLDSLLARGEYTPKKD